MTPFQSFGIAATQKNFTGDKIKMERILNRQICVYDYRIEDSRFNGKCLYLQIGIGENKHVVFSGSNTLMEMIQKVPQTGFPFTTTIVKDNDRFMFT